MPDYQVLPEPGRTRWILPGRRFGPWRLVALALVAFGAMFALGPVLGIQSMFASGNTPLSFRIFAMVFALPFLWGGWKVARFGILVLAARTTIELDEEALVAVEQAGPVRWRKRFVLADVRRIALNAAADGDADAPAFLRDRAAIEINPKGGGKDDVGPAEPHDKPGRKRRPHGSKGDFIAVGYPRELLRELADELAAAIADARGERTPMPVVETAARLESKARVQPRPAREAMRPAGTNIELERTADGLALRIPPRGVDRRLRGFLVFALIWCAFSATFATLFLAKSTGAIPVPAVAVITLFPCIGVGMLVGAVNAARKHARAEVVGDVLLVARKSLFRLRTHEWTRADLVSITMGPTGVEVNDVPVMAVLVKTQDGRTTKLFAGRENPELEWMAWELSRAMQLSEGAG